MIRRHIVDHYLGQAVVGLSSGRQQLAQTLHGIQQAGVGPRTQLDRVIDHQAIAFLTQRGIIHQLQADQRCSGILGVDVQTCQQCVQCTPGIGRGGPALHGRSGEPQLTGGDVHRRGDGHDMQRRRCCIRDNSSAMVTSDTSNSSQTDQQKFKLEG
ncbi:hypothetical protein D3C81_1667870 [compost metagenome]